MTLDEFIDWARRYQDDALNHVFWRLRRYPVMQHHHQPELAIARELALGGVKAALDVAQHHCRLPNFLEASRSGLWLREEAYRQALRLLPEHAFIGPFLEVLGAEEHWLLCCLYADHVNDRQLARLFGVAPLEARRRGWRTYQQLCNRLVQGGWGSDDATFPLYPDEFGRSGLGL